jgi:hypothetical protein
MLSLTIVIVLFVLWMRSSVANEEKERRMAYEARKVSQSQMSTLTQPHTAVSIPQAKSMTDYHSRVSIETNSRTSSGLSPQSLPLLSASASPNPSEHNRNQIYDQFKLGIKNFQLKQNHLFCKRIEPTLGEDFDYFPSFGIHTFRSARKKGVLFFDAWYGTHQSQDCRPRDLNTGDAENSWIKLY